MFDAAGLCLINKTDLLPHVDFDLARCREYALRVNHRLEFFEISAKTGEGMSDWLAWLRRQL
jgi:hydrogenase nickel incorporation protein HypB